MISKIQTQLQLSKTKCYTLLIGAMSVTTIVKYIIDAYQIALTQKAVAQFYPLFFFVVYASSILIAIIFYQQQQQQQSDAGFKYGTLWFTGFRFVVFNCLCQIGIVLIMELIFPSIKAVFLHDQEIAITKTLFNKESIQQNLLAIKKYYYLLKTAYFMFGMIVLGTILNTIICLLLNVYYKKITQR